MRSSLEGVEGVGLIDIKQGPDGFTVHFDSKKIDAQGVCEAIKKKRPNVKLKS